jgi:hypothetical protein
MKKSSLTNNLVTPKPTEKNILNTKSVSLLPIQDHLSSNIGLRTEEEKTRASVFLKGESTRTI